MKPMVFQKYGGIHQLRIESAEDLAFIHELHPARWAATSVQIESLQCDPAFLAYLNQDGSGTLRADHLRTAVAWTFEMLANRDRMAAAPEDLRLADLDTSHPEGQQLEQAAIHILGQLEAESLDQISLEQLRSFRNTYGMTSPNGDGVLPPEHISDPAAAQLATDVLQQVGGAKDISGEDGVNEDHLRQFLDRAGQYVAWMALVEGVDSARILPWGDDTAAAVQLIDAFDDKLEQFFWQCKLVKLDARCAEQFRLTEQALESLSGSDLQALKSQLEQAPLQMPNAAGRLNLRGAINPYYQDQIEALRNRVLARAHPDSQHSITQLGWQQVKAMFESYRAWQSEKPADSLAELSVTTLKAYLEGPTQATLFKLLLEDLAVADEVKRVADLEKLILYQRWLLQLANNFVCFSALYDPDCRALFELGDLIIDGRKLSFTMKVRNRAEHKKIAENSKIFLVYAEIKVPEQQGQSFEIAAALTGGGRGVIEIGKRGIFYDLEGKEWDARVVDLAESPISLREAIKSPFVKAKKLVTDKFEAFLGSRAGDLEKATTAMTTKLEKGESLGQSAPAPASGSGMRDLLLAGGIAFAALGSSLVYLLDTLSTIDPMKASLALATLLLVVMLFSALSGWNKLRRRDLSALLEACGWAVNFRMYMTRRLGCLFSYQPHLPAGAHKESRDLARKFLQQTGQGSSLWTRVGLIALLLAVLALVFLGASWGSGIRALLQGWWSG